MFLSNIVRAAGCTCKDGDVKLIQARIVRWLGGPGDSTASTTNSQVLLGAAEVSLKHCFCFGAQRSENDACMSAS